MKQVTGYVMKKHGDANEKEIRQAVTYKLSNEAKREKKRMLATAISDVEDESESQLAMAILNGVRASQALNLEEES